ncbi:hypothetical protein ABXJ56_00420 [Microbacterium chocolatum]|uniref:hypothetical protein n=1 Tax=Microbacterium aurantiacum TaxID=162393 RepID=UPI00338E6A8A
MQRRSIVVLAATGVVALALVGAVLVAVLTPRTESPEDVARAFADALTAGDGPAALALVDAVPEAAHAAAEALTGADQVPDSAEVVLVDRAGTRASFDLTIRLGQRTETGHLEVIEGADGWRVAAGIWGTLRVQTTRGDGARVGGAPVASDADVLLFPARYTVTAEPSELLDGAVEATVFPGTDQDVTVDAAPNDAALAAAQRAVEEYAGRCTAPATSSPENCGMRIPWPADMAELEELRFRIERMPQLEDLAGETFLASGGILVVTAEGADAAGAPRTVTYRSDTWSLRGTAEVTADGVALTVW